MRQDYQSNFRAVQISGEKADLIQSPGSPQAIPRKYL